MRSVIDFFSSEHRQALLNSMSQLGRTPVATFMTCLVIGITLALPAALFTALRNVQTVGAELQHTLQMTVFLKPGTVDQAAATTFAAELKNKKGVASVKTVSPEHGLQELQQDAGLQGALLGLSDNPLPWVIILQPKSTEDLSRLAASLQKSPLVDSLQLDEAWVNRLTSLMSLAERFIYLLTAFLSMAVLLIINNVIRSTTQQNEKEIEIIKLFGGTNAFIRRPFLYAGMAYGLLGGIIAWLLVDMLLLAIRAPLQHLLTLYNSTFQVMGMGFSATLVLLGSSMLLGLTGSWFAVTRKLRKC